VTIGLVPSYAALCAVQAALVLVPGRVRPRRPFPAAGILVPTLAFGVGIALLRGPSAGPISLAVLGTVATPILAGLCGLLLGFRRPWAPAALAAALYVLAWQLPGPAGEAAGVVLIGMACLTLAASLASLTPRRSIEFGLVVLALVDVVLVWGTPQVGPATTVLERTGLPSAGLHLLPTRTLPELQQATFGSAVMGWLDLLAPALLGVIVDRNVRRRAALVTGLAAAGWGLLLTFTSPIPATVPVLAGLLVARGGTWMRAARRTRSRATQSPAVTPARPANAPTSEATR
jgi:hypothetical protein